MEAQTETAIAIKDDEKILMQSDQLVNQANEIVIKDDLTCHQATDIAKTLKTFLEGPGTYHDEEIDMVNALRDKLHEKRHKIIDGPKAAYKAIKDRIAFYIDEQRRKQEEAQRKAEEEARRIEAEKQAKIQAKIDEENRKIAEKKAEENRIRREKEGEIKRQKDKETRERMQREEEERRAAERRRIAEQNRQAEERKAALQEKKESVYVAPKMVAPVSTPTGTSVSFTWDAKVIQKERVPEQYKVVDVAMLEKMQRAAKGNLVVTGVVFTKRAIGALRK